LSEDLEIKRRLAAVFAADVAGYSRLMDFDEVGTLRALSAARAIMDGLIARHRGRIANTAGDSVLAEFPSAVDAVQCAVEVQRALRDAAEGTPADKRVLFRIGIHVGDVMVRGGDLLGGGINVAARLEAIAETGGVIISGAAHEQVRKILPLAYTDLGAQTMKNIEEPIRAFAIGASPRAVLGSTELPAPDKPLPLPDKPSIAVLPFANMSGDPEQEYFADGMVEDIITALSRFKSLFVIARNSSFTYKGKAVDIKQVGRELGVRYVLEGSVRKAGGRVRVTGQLIEAATGAHLWAERFDGSLEDIFKLQDDITSAVVSAVAPELERAEIELAARKPTQSLAAYELCLRGMARMYQNTRQTHQEAFDLFSGALRLDPNYAFVYAQLANWFTHQKVYGWASDRERETAQASEFARRAIALVNDDTAVLAPAGYALAFVAHELDEGASVVNRAVQMNPNYAPACFWAGFVRVYLGQQQEAQEYFDRVIRLSPMEQRIASAHNGIALTHLFSGRYEEANSWANQALQRRRNLFAAHMVASICLAYLGRTTESGRSRDQVLQIDPAASVAKLEAFFPFKRSEDHERFVQGLRLAGFPE
jgi:TolB-like protein/class 3 adenylate cyclase/Tfp pilus assembly protein PilF